MPVTLDDLRRFAIGRSLFAPTTLARAIEKMAFVQADPIRSPARAQDLMLRHRVKNYCAGDLERRYESLGVAEDVFVNYGYVTSSLQRLMHPRPAAHGNRVAKHVQSLLDFLRERGPTHPREVNSHFLHGRTTNYFGGSSNATTQLLQTMHCQGLLRVARRENGIRVYAVQEHDPEPRDKTERQERIDKLADAAVNIYAPMPAASLSFLLRRLRYAAPQWRAEVGSAVQRAKQRLSHTRVDGVDWYWPADEKAPRRRTPSDEVRLLAPFDPVVWDRPRFEMFWGWRYRFEAYTPAPKRIRGYYSLPMLWRDRVIGWANLSMKSGNLEAGFGYVESAPRDAVFKRELAVELDRVRAFLGAGSGTP